MHLRWPGRMQRGAKRSPDFETCPQNPGLVVPTRREVAGWVSFPAVTFPEHADKAMDLPLSGSHKPPLQRGAPTEGSDSNGSFPPKFKRSTRPRGPHGWRRREPGLRARGKGPCKTALPVLVRTDVKNPLSPSVQLFVVLGGQRRCQRSPLKRWDGASSPGKAVPPPGQNTGVPFSH